MKITVIGGALYQWDTGRKISITVGESETVSNIHYSNGMVAAVTAAGSCFTAPIPNILLQEAQTITAYAVIVSADGSRTLYDHPLLVCSKPKPDDYIYTETEIYTIKTAVEMALQEAKESGEFDGKDGHTPKKGVDYFTDEEMESFAEEVAEDVKKTLPTATNDTLGVVKGTPNGDYGILINAKGEIQVRRATTDDINARKHQTRPIVPANLKQAVTSVFEDVYADVYVKTGKLGALVKSIMDSMHVSVWDGDEVNICGQDVRVSVDNLKIVQGDFRGQLLYIRTNRAVYEIYMYLGLDVMGSNVWEKIGELPD